jgi:hypothetical protein
MTSRSRDSRIAHLRPVRRIPLIVTCNTFRFTETVLAYYAVTQQNEQSIICSSCIDILEGLCDPHTEGPVACPGCGQIEG